MKAIILAGGTGTRLWPVSRNENPKQVEAIVGNETLLQATYSRIRKAFAPEDVYLATSVSQKDVVMAQLPELPKRNFIFEPSRKETAAAIGFALLHVAKDDPEATFVTINSDAYVKDDDEYHRVIAAADEAIGTHPDHVVLVGITPSYPETGYGYIRTDQVVARVGKKDDPVHKVDRFVEKPDLPTAERYLAEGNYLWNPTLIAARVDTFLSLFDEHLPEHGAVFRDISRALAERSGTVRVAEHFSRISPVSIDYGILEKAERLLVIPADFGWADVGNWRTVRDILASEEAENVVKGTHVGIDSSGNLIYSYSDKLIATAGVKDMVIIETKDAILVCPKERAQDVKKIVGELREREHLKRFA